MSNEPVAENRVFLHGRLADSSVDRELPSGDVLTTFRLVVDRPEGERGRVDTLDCVTVAARVRRTLAKAAPGDWLELTGSLRRRFWRGPAGVASRYAVDVTSAKTTRRAKQSTRRPTDPAADGAPNQTRASV